MAKQQYFDVDTLVPSYILTTFFFSLFSKSTFNFTITVLGTFCLLNNGKT